MRKPAPSYESVPGSRACRLSPNVSTHRYRKPVMDSNIKPEQVNQDRRHLFLRGAVALATAQLE